MTKEQIDAKILEGIQGGQLNADIIPLLVLDGLPLEEGTFIGNGVGDVKPEDIESLTILKGASAAAIYGSRAANGVVIATGIQGK